ncbi:hypothetical protein GCM10017767_24340 [Halomonas urumqiensis]|nr:hypothetical protein GCM10017767_24340 [Halomonas urumqiensis]
MHSKLEASESAGEWKSVRAKALAQAERLAGGNAADRWARAVYLQLAADAETRAGNPGAAAEHLRLARETPGVEAKQRDTWQRREARLRLAAGDDEGGASLLSDWLTRHGGEADDHWRLARALAEAGRWQDAASRVELALERTPAPDAAQRRLAITVWRRSGDDEAALSMLADGLKDTRDPARWREASALAQRLGDTGRAAAIWETAWRRGIFEGEEALRRRIHLHMAGGTPARAAEALAEALQAGTLEDSDAHRRLLAQAWEAARERDLALAAWEALATRTDAGEDWLRLGQLAHAWGREAVAERALTRADALGQDAAERWLEALVSASSD